MRRRPHDHISGQVSYIFSLTSFSTAPRPDSFPQTRVLGTMSSHDKSSVEFAEKGHESVIQVTDVQSTSIEDERRVKALVLKQDLRIVPLCAAIYLLCYLDRSNIGTQYWPSPCLALTPFTRHRECKNTQRQCQTRSSL
jgi:hypothetical protein